MIEVYRNKKYTNMNTAQISCREGAVFSNCTFTNTDILSSAHDSIKFDNCTLSGEIRASNYGSSDYLFTGCTFNDVNILNYSTYFEFIDCTAVGMELPTGDIIAYKALDEGIATLLIPGGTARVRTLEDRKCRAEWVKVLEIYAYHSNNPLKSCYNCFPNNPVTCYEVGEVVIPDEYDPNMFIGCSHGISFFLTKKEALSFAHTYMGIFI